MKNYKKGQNSNVFIIAELSANHNGSLETALETIKAAKSAGADCIKLQTYTADTITIDCDKPDFKIKGTIWEGRKLHDLYKEAYTPWEWHAELFKAAKEGYPKIVKKLLQAGAKTNIENSKGNTPLRIAELNKNKEVIEKLCNVKGTIKFRLLY